jgi:hypothetical protein
VHIAVISHSDGWLTELCGPLKYVGEFISSIEEAVLCVKMEMTELGHAASPRTNTVEFPLPKRRRLQLETAVQCILSASYAQGFKALKVPGDSLKKLRPGTKDRAWQARNSLWVLDVCYRPAGL